jgi:hypothetical protein
MIHKTIINLLNPVERFTFYWLGGLISGGLGLLGGILGNRSRKRQAANANQLTMEQFNRQLGFNAEQASLSRQHASGMMHTAMGFNAHEAALSRAFSAAEAAKARNWMKVMSQTQHQREVKDLRKAGLNPILSAHGGASVGGSPSAAGTAASVNAAQSAAASAAGSGTFQQAQIVDPMSSAAQNMEAFARAEKTDTEIGLVEKQIEKVGEDANLTREQTKEVTEKIHLIRIQVEKEWQTKRKAHAEADMQFLKVKQEQAVHRFFNSNEGAAIIDRVGVSKGAYMSVVGKINDLLNDITSYGSGNSFPESLRR